jgi:hypothetical protein
MDTLVPSATQTPLSSFHLFPQLPLELRLKVWRYLIDQPRVLKLIACKSFNQTSPSFTSRWVSLNHPVPVPLRICQECREEALKSLQLAFGSWFCHANIYINFSLDTVRFGDGPSPTSSDKSLSLEARSWAQPSDYVLNIFLGGGAHGAEDYEKVRSMVLDVSEDLYARRNFCWDDLRLLTGLEELTLLVWEPDHAHGQLMGRYKESLRRVARAHPEWIVPRIMVIGMESGTDWGLLMAPAVERSLVESS